MIKNETSAGGVVFKKEGNQRLILVSQHSAHHGWVFPKGLVGDHYEGEQEEETAVREVKEETGIEAKIVKRLPPVDYFYRLEKQTIHKTVQYFLMEFSGGKIEDHDWEMEKVEWLPMEEVEKRLTYKSDQEVWLTAKKLMAEISR